MFQSYTYNNNNGGMSFGGLHTRLVIVDSDFSVSRGVDLTIPLVKELFEFVINTYETRSLSVAPNLMLAVRFFAGRNKFPMDYAIHRCNNETPMFAKYKSDIEKYLPLI